MNLLRVVYRSVMLSAVVWLAGCATAGHPCFSERVMFADKSAACQYGRSYRCDNGDWIADRKSCNETAPKLAAAAAQPGSCEFAGLSFASGSASCNAGTQYRCEDGRWSSLNLPCPVGDTPFPVTPHGEPCSYHDATVASSSAICQAGTTFLCNSGQWINLGTVCR